MAKSRKQQSRKQSRKQQSRRRQKGGANEWIKYVKSVHQEMKKKNSNASYTEAMKEASKRKKK
jgi:hypothetical protein